MPVRDALESIFSSTIPLDERRRLAREVVFLEATGSSRRRPKSQRRRFSFFYQALHRYQSDNTGPPSGSQKLDLSGPASHVVRFPRYAWPASAEVPRMRFAAQGVPSASLPTAARLAALLVAHDEE